MPEAGAALARASDLCRQRPCSGYELHAAGVLAGDPGQAWLRLCWLEAVLSWPQRFIRTGPAHPDVRGTATG